MPTSLPRTDADLMAAIAERHEPALDQLHDRYRPFAQAVAQRVLRDPARAEDVVQDAFLTVWLRAGSYVPARGSVRTWIGTVVRNRAVDVIRARREVTREDDAALAQLRDPEPEPPAQVAAGVDAAQVRGAIERLPEEQRAAIGMAYFLGRSHSEIADRTGLPLGTVKSRVRLGVARLRRLIDPAGVGPTAS